MNSLLRTILLSACALMTCLGHFTQVLAQAPAETQLEFSEGVIVLDDGRVFSGKISNVTGGYRVEWNGTYAIVPFAKVDVTSPTLHGAYVALRDRILKPTAADHLQLAEWCLSNKLVGQARTEVTKALTLEPLRPEARVLMTQIDDLINPEKQKVQLPSQAAMTIDGFLRAEQDKSSGMNRQAHQDFIRQIQPLLMNKCGNAACHGASAQNTFQLQAIHRGTSGNRLQSQQNLEAVLKFIDKSNPGRSQLLLTDPTLNSVHRKVFLGSRGAIQYQILSNWVASVAGKPLTATSQPAMAANAYNKRPGSGEANSSMNRPTQPSSNSIQLLSAQEIVPASATERRDQINRSTANSTDDLTSLNKRQQAALRQEAIQQAQPDPFDPEIFNRRIHGSTAKELKAAGRSEPTQSN